MDGPHQPRGRGFKINGASSRPHSRNKQWINGLDNSGHGSDSERWERGGPRRGRGRGRGSARSTPQPHQLSQHLTVPGAQEDTLSGTEDEGQDDAYSGMEDDEVEVVDLDEKDPETPEERERFYQELVKARETERKKAIADGKMDDPLVPKRLDEAITMVGTCLDMCPKFERYRRERENNLDRWEVIPGTKRVDHKRAVKIYERAAGDKTLPSDLRPPPVLKKTLDYLFHDLIPRGGFRETYTFIRDRSRAVRNDFTMQHETGALAIECHDRCARFHILALHLERDKPNFSLALEEQQLMNTLQSLKEFYEDQRGRYQSPTELEMRVYHRLIHIRDQKERHEDIPPEILHNPIFQLVTRFRVTVQAKSAPISKTSKLTVDQEALEIFGQLAAVLREQNNIVMIYLVACIMERLFGKDTIEDIESIRGDLTIPEIIDGISRPVEIMEYEPTPSPDQPQPTALPDTGQSVAHTATEFPSSNFGSSPFGFMQATRTIAPAPNGDIKSAFTPTAPPPQSAFGNLTSTTTTFSSPTSVFGGPTFSNSATKSVFGGPVFGSSGLPPSVVSSQVLQPPSAPAPLTRPQFDTNIFSAPTFVASTPAAQAPPLAHSLVPNGALFSQAAPTPVPPTTIPTRSGSGGFQSYKPAVPSPLNPNANSFTPNFSVPKPTQTEPPAQAPSTPAITAPPAPASVFPSAALSALSALSTSPEATATPLAFIPTAPSTPPPQERATEASQNGGSSRIIDRRQTLWDFPGIPSRHDDQSAAAGPTGILPTPTTPVPLSPSNMPQMSKPAPLTLPPTPTARWFDPASIPTPARENSSLLLRKQSLGLFGLQMPDSSPVAPEILSPLTLPSPKPKPPSGPFGIPTPSFTAPATVASSSKLLLDGVDNSTSPTRPSKSKGKAKEVEPDFDVMALNFLRKGLIVKKYFEHWIKRATDRAAYAEALRRSDAYKEKVRHHRLSSSSGPISGKERPSEAKKRRVSLTSTSEPMQAKRSRRRISAEYHRPVSDEELVRRLKENHEEHQHRWARGTFLESIRHCVRTATADEDYPPEWRIWLSVNAVNDGTAIWLETKFDVPESGEWQSDNIFSIPVLPKYDNPPSPGAPGLIVFERTPMDGVDDVLERKYRILDDCARLRDMIEIFRKHSQPRFKPSLAIIIWSETDGPEAAPDFGDMIKEFRASGTIRDVQSLVISSTATDLDKMFEDLLCRLKLDVEDKLTAILSWRALTDVFTTQLRTYASDWLDSCWSNDKLDWTRYGEVTRSFEDVQNALLRELLSLLDAPIDVKVEIPIDLDDSAHLSAAYASGPYLDACLRLPVARAEEVLGEELAAVYAIPRSELEESRLRFEGVLQATSDRLRQLAAAMLLAQKRPLPDESPSGSPGSTNKRFKLSVSPASTEDGDVSGADGFLTPPPLSTSASTAVFSDVPPKPEVTIAMLRALAQGVLKSK